MAVGQGILGNSTVTHKAKDVEDIARVKLGVKKLRDAIILDMKRKSTRGSGLPKDWRSRIIK